MMEELFAKRRNPLTDQECFPQAEPMFDIIKLREAYEHFTRFYATSSSATAAEFFRYLYRLEKDVPLNQQKVQK